jgi:hypothetical protein
VSLVGGAHPFLLGDHAIAGDQTEENRREETESRVSTLRNLSSRQIWTAIVVIGLLLILTAIYWKNSQSLVQLRPQGKAVFYRGGFFHQDKFTLDRQGSKWLFFRSEDLESGELILPFECPYNQYRTLRLENDGRVYMLDNEKMTREEQTLLLI